MLPERFDPSTESQLGSWFDGWNSKGSSGLAQTLVKTTIKLDTYIESRVARGIYWVVTVLGLAISAYCIWIIHKSGYSHDSLIEGAIIIACALLTYVTAWGWRWLWTGRVDHFFAGKKYTPPGRLEEARKNVSSVLAFWNF